MSSSRTFYRLPLVPGFPQRDHSNCIYAAFRSDLAFTTWLFRPIASRSSTVSRRTQHSGRLLLCLFRADSHPSILAHARAFAGFRVGRVADLSLYYRFLCLFFRKLGDWHGTMEIFMYGAVVYLIVLPSFWIAWPSEVRRSTLSHHNNHAELINDENSAALRCATLLADL